MDIYAKGHVYAVDLEILTNHFYYDSFKAESKVVLSSEFIFLFRKSTH